MNMNEELPPPSPRKTNPPIKNIDVNPLPIWMGEEACHGRLAEGGAATRCV